MVPGKLRDYLHLVWVREEREKMQNWRHFSIHHTHRAVNRDLAS